MSWFADRRPPGTVHRARRALTPERGGRSVGTLAVNTSRRGSPRTSPRVRAAAAALVGVVAALVASGGATPAGATETCAAGDITLIGAPTLSASSPLYVGNTVTSTGGNWNSCVDPFTGFYKEWLRNGVIISGPTYVSGAPTSFTYAVQTADVQQSISSAVNPCNVNGCYGTYVQSGALVPANRNPNNPSNLQPATTPPPATTAQPLSATYSDPDQQSGYVSYSIYHRNADGSNGTLAAGGDTNGHTGAVASGSSSSWTPPALPTGQYNWEAKAVDALGWASSQIRGGQFEIVPAVTITTQTAAYVEFTNGDGTWRFYKTCADGVGPGYVSKLTINRDINGNVITPHVVVDAVNESSQSPTVPIGLGRFIARDARAAQGSTLTMNVNAFELDGRSCYGVNGALAGPDSTASHMIDNTPAVGTDGVGSFDEIVQFRDQNTAQLLQVIYKWKIYWHYVKMWADVYEQCSGGPSGTCGSPSAWIKGPKFIAGVNGNPDGVPFTQLTTWSDASSAVCAFDGSDPGAGTGHIGVCSDAGRTALQFNYVDAAHLSDPATMSASPNCFATQRCFGATFRTYAPDACLGCITPGSAPTDVWTGLLGLDDWASHANGRAAEGVWDTCSAEQTPSAARQWEALGNKTPNNWTGGYNNAAGYFFGWRDCVNVADDRALFVANAVEQWGTYAAFSFNSDTVNYFAWTTRG